MDICWVKGSKVQKCQTTKLSRERHVCKSKRKEPYIKKRRRKWIKGCEKGRIVKKIASACARPCETGHEKNIRRCTDRDDVSSFPDGKAQLDLPEGNKCQRQRGTEPFTVLENQPFYIQHAKFNFIDKSLPALKRRVVVQRATVENK